MAADRDIRKFIGRLTGLVVAILVLIVCGAVALSITDDISLWTGFLHALDIVATTGAYPPTDRLATEIVRVLLTVLGVGTLFYALVSVTELLVAGHVADLLAARRMQKMIDGTSDHFIICGYGRVGRQVARDLRGAGMRYVILDNDPANRESARGVGVRFIEAEPSDDRALRQAGIERARAVIACVDSDAENVFITLTARELSPDIAIVARASQEDSERKLLRAGATRVISPYKASGAEMARLALHPQVSGVRDVDAEYRMEEILVPAGCPGEGQTIGDIRGGAYIVGLRRAGAGFQPQPQSETVLQAGDVIMAMGTPNTMDRLEALFAPSSAGVPS
ncbi:MAG TPA: TrkA family potassium uptake protein [Baekduia sp.]|nr:TrkA family potassium uptake protein [Baekduia sp.]